MTFQKLLKFYSELVCLWLLFSRSVELVWKSDRHRTVQLEIPLVILFLRVLIRFQLEPLIFSGKVNSEWWLRRCTDSFCSRLCVLFLCTGVIHPSFQLSGTCSSLVYLLNSIVSLLISFGVPFLISSAGIPSGLHVFFYFS